jgi:hypothetical protein
MIVATYWPSLQTPREPDGERRDRDPVRSSAMITQLSQATASLTPLPLVGILPANQRLRCCAEGQ